MEQDAYVFRTELEHTNEEKRNYGELRVWRFTLKRLAGLLILSDLPGVDHLARS
jgi:hypothetical protein